MVIDCIKKFGENNTQTKLMCMKVEKKKKTMNLSD